jgi:hypothetical protein
LAGEARSFALLVEWIRGGCTGIVPRRVDLAKSGRCRKTAGDRRNLATIGVPVLA